MKQSDSVLLIYTGGTIGMYKTNEGSLSPFDLDTLGTQIPELITFDIDHFGHINNFGMIAFFNDLPAKRD